MALGRQAGWQETAAVAATAAEAALLRSEEIPRVAAETAAREVARVAAARGGYEVGLAALAAARAADVPAPLAARIAATAIAETLASCDRLRRRPVQDVGRPRCE